MELEFTSFKSKWISHPGVLWEEHTREVAQYSVRFARELPSGVHKLVPGGLLTELAYWIAIFHDLGKTTPYFQEYIHSENPVKSEISRHSLLSAVVAFWVVQKWLSGHSVGKGDENLLSFVVFLVIRSHHGNLTNPLRAALLGPDAVERLQKQWYSIDRVTLENLWGALKIPMSLKEIDTNISGLPGSFRPKRFLIRELRKRRDFSLYFLTNLLFSILLDADKSAAGLSGLEENLPDLPVDVVDRFREANGWNQPLTTFDRLRNSVYTEAIHKIESGRYDRILNLQIPTGFGKTFTAFSAAVKILHQKQLNRIIYSLPFTSIIDQNFQELSKLLEQTLERKIDSTLLLKHHYLSDVFYSDDSREYNPLESQLLMEGWNSRIVVTTFVQLFHTLVGHKNRMLRKFHRMANSVIILDEIQSIPFKYWNLLNELIRAFVQIFNSYVILVTATEPRLFAPEQKTDLVNSTPYFKSINRVVLRPDFSSVENLEEFGDRVLDKAAGKKRIIVVLNTIGSARLFYDQMVANVENLFYLSSHIVPKQRLTILNELLTRERYFLVTTQLIEAGVNLDAEMIFRDLGPLDSINQVAGRCNRFAKEHLGEVFVFKLLDENSGRALASYVYDASLLEITQKTLNESVISEPDFLRLCDAYFSRMAHLPQKESEELLASVANLRYSDGEQAIDQFRLIDQGYAKQDVFVEWDTEAREIWQAYLDLAEIPDHWKRRKQYLKIKNQFQRFIISVGEKDLKKNQPPIIGGLFYVPQSQLEAYYDPATGFKIIGETAIW